MVFAVACMETVFIRKVYQLRLILSQTERQEDKEQRVVKEGELAGSLSIIPEGL